MKPVFVAIGILALVGCRHPMVTQGHESDSSSELVEISHPLSKDKSAPAVSEIYMRRNPGPNAKTAPSYGLIMRSDGTATYIGQSLQPRQGAYQTPLSRADFNRLIKLVTECHFLDLEPFYGPTAHDYPRTNLSILWNGRRKTVVDGCTPGDPMAPKGLAELEILIDNLVANAKWKLTTLKTNPPEYDPKFDTVLRHTEKP